MTFSLSIGEENTTVTVNVTVAALTQTRQAELDRVAALVADAILKDNASLSDIRSDLDLSLNEIQSDAIAYYIISAEFSVPQEYQAYLKLHNGQAPENFMVEQKVTADALMDEILKAKGLSEEKIQETIETSKERFLLAEAEKTLSYRSFLYTQFRLIKKRWWLFQILLLVALWVIFPLADDALYAYRSMGVAAALFIILIIPELWKNRTNQCMEIESATYYSLRQVYSARMLLFGIVDVSIITVFCGIASISLKLSLTDLLIQFLFPLVVTACICFGILCNKRAFNETVAVGMCIIWSALWWFILLDERIYTAITIPVWVTLFGIALIFMVFTVYRSIHQCSRIWEEKSDGTKND